MCESYPVVRFFQPTEIYHPLVLFFNSLDLLLFLFVQWMSYWPQSEVFPELKTGPVFKYGFWLRPAGAVPSRAFCLFLRESHLQRITMGCPPVYETAGVNFPRDRFISVRNNKPRAETLRQHVSSVVPDSEVGARTLGGPPSNQRDFPFKQFSKRPLN